MYGKENTMPNQETKLLTAEPLKQFELDGYQYSDELLNRLPPPRRAILQPIPPRHAPQATTSIQQETR